MKIVRTELLEKIADRLSWLKSKLELENAICLYNNNIGSEDFVCGLLNLVYDYNLVNLNKYKKNYEGIDLGDLKNKIAVQVTTETKHKKVQDTIDAFIKNGYEVEYSRLIFMLLKEKSRYNAEFNTQNKFQFDKKRDIITIKGLIQDISNRCSDERVSEICRYLEQKLNFAETDANANKFVNINEFLMNEKEKIYALCLAKLSAVGINNRLGIEIIKDDLDSKDRASLIGQGAQYLIGEFGSGKSHFLYELSLYYIERYMQNKSDKILVFFEAIDLITLRSIEKYADEVQIDLNKSIIVIDGLDEVEYAFIEKIIKEIDYLEIRYKNIVIITSSRYMSILTGKKIVYMPLLNNQQINNLCRKITGDDAFRIERYFRNDKNKISKMLEKPFFVILYAKYIENGRYLRNEIELIDIFVNNSLQPYLKKNPNIEMQMEQIAIMAINRNYSSILTFEIPVEIDQDELLKSGFFRMQKDKYYTCTFPIIIQWLGARAIRNNLVDIYEIINKDERLFQWRYSITILFSQMTFEESEKYFRFIVEKKPGIASVIIRDGINIGSLTNIWDVKKSGVQLYNCMKSWLKGLGELGNTIGLTDGNNINTLGISYSDRILWFSWADAYMGEDVIVIDENIFSFSSVSAHFHRRCSRHIPAQATWPWVITFEYLSDLIKQCIERKHWIVLDGALEKEFIWSETLKLKNKGSLYTEHFKIKDMEKYRNMECIRGNNIKTYFYFVDRLLREGIEDIKVPYILGDRKKKSGYIWSRYSREQMKMYIENVYLNTFAEYQKLVETFFKSISDQLSTYLILPCKIVGALCYDDSNTEDYDSEPSFQYYLIPLPYGEKICIEITLCSERDYLGKRSEEIFPMLQREARKYRGDKCKNIGFTICGGRCMDSSETPVTDLVYKLLIDDMKSIGWIK